MTTTISTGVIGDEFDYGSSYAQTFGRMGHKSLYHSGARGYSGKGKTLEYANAYSNEMLGIKSMPISMMDHRLGGVLGQAFERGLKAQTTQTGGAGTAGYALIPVFVDPAVIDQTRKYTPLVELIPRVTNMGMYADYNAITAKGVAYTQTEGGAQVETDDTYDRYSTQIKFLYSVGKVTGPSQVAQPSYIMRGFEPSGGAQMSPFSDASAGNAMQQSVLVKTRALKEFEENLIINGNASTNGVSTNLGPNGSEFSGIVTLMSTTNTVGKSTSDLQLADCTKAVRYAFDDGGRPNLAVCASSVYEDLEILLQQKYGYFQSEKTVFWGFNTIVLRTMVGDIPVIPSMFLSNTSGSKAIYFLDMSVVEMRVLQDMTYEEKFTEEDGRKFMLKIYEALIIKNTSFCASVTAIK